MVYNVCSMLCCVVYRFTMGIAGILISLAVSCALVAYLFYALAPVPSDIEQPDHVFWVFAKQKYFRGLVSTVYADELICDIRQSDSAVDINSCC